MEAKIASEGKGFKGFCGINPRGLSPTGPFIPQSLDPLPFFVF